MTVTAKMQKRGAADTRGSTPALRRSSGVEWLGDIPSDWTPCTIRKITRVRAERNRPDLPLLSVYRDHGVVVRTEDDDNHNVIPTDLSGYKVVHAGDLVLNKMKTWQGSLGVADRDGIVSPAYVVCRLLGEANPRFIHLLLRCSRYIFEYSRLSYGVRIDQWDMRYADFKAIPLFLPPRPEQNAIVAFLGRKLEEIDRFIAAKKRMIDLLEEQKAAMIERAVTKGLNPNAKMKPSGLAYVGDVPAHWELRRNRFVFDEINERSVDGNETPLSMSQKLGLVPADNVEQKTLQSATRENFKLCRRDDLVLNRLKAHLGVFARATIPGTVSPDYSVFRMRVQGEAYYFERLFKTSAYIAVFRNACRGIVEGFWRLYTPDFYAITALCPPAEEQAAIVRWITTENVRSQGVAANAQREIELMAEYRTSLISDAVTGKINLFAVAPVTSLAASASLTTEPAKAGRTANIHFKRSVFAAEIIHRLHQEPTFGHVKCEKLIFLCEKRCRVETGSNYRRKAAGPYDPHALRSIDSQIGKQRWYSVKKTDQRYRYVPLPKAGGHQTYFRRYFAEVEAEFSRVIDTFRSFDTVRCEIVSTLYSAWEDLLSDSQQATDDQIIEQVLEHWHPSKQRIPEDRWRKAIGWMRVNGFVPRKSADGRITPGAQSPDKVMVVRVDCAERTETE